MQAAKPFSRGRDDKDLNQLQREALRWGDPMAHLVAKRMATTIEEQAPSLVNLGNKKAMKKSGDNGRSEGRCAWSAEGEGAYNVKDTPPSMCFALQRMNLSCVLLLVSCRLRDPPGDTSAQLDTAGCWSSSQQVRHPPWAPLGWGRPKQRL